MVLSFGQKISAGFAAIIVLTVAVSAVAVISLQQVVASKDRIITVDTPLLADTERMRAALTREVAAARAFYLTREERYADELQQARADFKTIIDRLKQGVGSAEGRQALDAIEQGEADHRTTVDRIVALRRTDASLEAVVRSFDDQATPRRDALESKIAAFVATEERLLEAARVSSSASAATALLIVLGIVSGAVVLAALAAFWLTRSLARQIGTAVGQVQSSSAELQAAANQQASGSREQATAMSEITTTISELLATSRQIAESAQRVAQIAEQTAGNARSGNGTVGLAQDSIAGIRRQVDQIVAHMLELGSKSQQIGAVLDIVFELAEQTNILAINATIEAAGAGDSGKRFAVVADEIRKLADRVGGSTKEIRVLIDDVRSAVNTTVMATETGSKAVDAGARHFDEVAAGFRQIAALVATTTDAAREIELSTKQQSTAVEQVNGAIGNVAQASKESEASATQTLQTASQLAGLSRDLSRIIRTQAAA